MSLYTEAVTKNEPGKSSEMIALTGEPLSKLYFDQLSGILGSVPFVKFVVDRKNSNTIYFLNDRFYPLHAYYVCDHVVKEQRESFLKKIDAFNENTYHSDDRRFYFGTIGKIKHENRSVYTLETQEIDSMKGPLIEDLYSIIKSIAFIVILVLLVYLALRKAVPLMWVSLLFALLNHMSHCY